MKIEELNKLIKDVIEKEGVFWNKPWFVIPKQNGYTGHIYRGLNRFFLKEQFYFTPKQIQKLGGKVKEGAISDCVIYWNTFIRVNPDEDPVDGEIFTVLKGHKVYGLSQIEFLEKVIEKIMAKFPKGNPDQSKIELAEKILQKVKKILPEVLLDFNYEQAYYNLRYNEIVLPKWELFHDNDEIILTTLHEIGHAIVHNKFQDVKLRYAEEECVVEIAAVLIGADYGIRYSDNNVAYIQSWKKAIAEIEPNWWGKIISLAEKIYAIFTYDYNTEKINEKGTKKKHGKNNRKILQHSQ